MQLSFKMILHVTSLLHAIFVSARLSSRYNEDNTSKALPAVMTLQPKSVDEYFHFFDGQISLEGATTRQDRVLKTGKHNSKKGSVVNKYGIGIGKGFFEVDDTNNKNKGEGKGIVVLAHKEKDEEKRVGEEGDDDDDDKGKRNDDTGKRKRERRVREKGNGKDGERMRTGKI